MKSAGPPPTRLNTPPAISTPLYTTNASTSEPAPIPFPSGCQLVPFHWAMRLRLVAPLTRKRPPAIKLPLKTVKAKTLLLNPALTGCQVAHWAAASTPNDSVAMARTAMRAAFLRPAIVRAGALEATCAAGMTDLAIEANLNWITRISQFVLRAKSAKAQRAQSERQQHFAHFASSRSLRSNQ